MQSKDAKIISDFLNENYKRNLQKNHSLKERVATYYNNN